MKILLTISLTLLFSLASYSQINAYAKVSAISGNSINVSNVNQNFHSFAVGEKIIIMQMQDDIIGTNTGDDINFGDMSTISSAGLYEVRQIESIDGISTVGYSAVNPTTIIVVNNLLNTFNINVNSSVQVISYREMSTGDYTTTADITGLEWDGNVGGVIALSVPGTLTLNHDINADGIGFRGGLRSINGSIPICSEFPYRANGATTNGFKGEGIYKSTDPNHASGRAKILTGGGGGAGHNGGGGGGGNFSVGGIGSFGYHGGSPVCGSNRGYGFGGVGLSAHINGNRIFMGGGGGGGEQNNSVGTDGTDGGGIILLSAAEVVTLGTCAGRSITANGLNAIFAGNDGAGGAGAAGSIVFSVTTWSVGAACDLLIESNGGTGGSAITGSNHGGGGAGAQGVIIFNGILPVANITATTLNGGAGCNNNSVPCNSFAGSAPGINNSGILAIPGGPLPVELISFDAVLNLDSRVYLTWATASEMNNDFFEIEKSLDGIQWEVFKVIDGAGYSTNLIEYSDMDRHPSFGLSYYRLSQTDFDGTKKVSDARVIFNADSGVNSFPNPAVNVIRFTEVDYVSDKFQLVDLLGKDVTMTVSIMDFDENSVRVDLSLLPGGTYIFKSGGKIHQFVKIEE